MVASPRLVLRDPAGHECDAIHDGCGQRVEITIERSGLLATCAKCGVVRKRAVKAVPLTMIEAQRRRHERAIAAQDRGASSDQVGAIRTGVAVDERTVAAS